MSDSKKSIYNLSIDEALQHLGSRADGLSIEEARYRLKKFGLNELTSKKTPLLRRIIEPFTSYFVIVILIAAFISILESKWFEALIISAVIIVNAILYYFQQFSVNRVLKTLQSNDKQKINIVRDGENITTTGEYLVPGDIVRVIEGMKVPADGRLIEVEYIQTNESALTGESLPVHKQADAIKGDKELYDQSNMVFRGTYIKSGSGLMLVTNTGNNTQLGNINTLAAEAGNSKGPIEQKIDNLTKKLLIAVGILSSIVFTLALIRGIDLEEAIRFTLSITVSAVPEGLPVAMTLVLLFSARKMARQKALVKKISAMQTLGAVTLIATDKTGTLTRNKLSVADSFTPHTNSHIFHEAIRGSLNGGNALIQDPLDHILRSTIARLDMPKSLKHKKDFPFVQELRLSGVVWLRSDGKYILYAKGAPEQIFSLTSYDQHKNSDSYLKLNDFTSKGYRTIGFAHLLLDELPESLNTKLLKNMSFDGFVALSDQIRSNVRRSIDDAHNAGIKVIMLTGDHVETAGYVAKQVGIASNYDEVASSSSLINKSIDQIRDLLNKTRAFGRVLPEHKYKLLQATKKTEITAMTGDGVNDIPALVEADVGFAMGSGTDAAKDSSDIVLVDDNFKTIITAIRAGRTVLANIRKMVVYLLGTSGGEVLTMLVALAAGMPLPITAAMVLWVNLVTDGISVIPLGLSPSESHQMKHPPRSPSAPLLDKILLSRAIVLASVMAASVLFIFNLNLPNGLAYAQTTAFLSLIVIQWANAFNMNYEYRSWIYNLIRPNYLLVAAIGLSMLVNIAIFTIPSLRSIFGLVALDSFDAIVAIVVPVVLALITSDLHKLVVSYLRKKN